MLVVSPIEYSLRGSKSIIEEGVVLDSFVTIKPAGGMGDKIFSAGPGSIVNGS